MFPLIDKNENIHLIKRLSKVQWMNKRCRPPPPRVPQSKYLGFWGCKDLSNSTDNFIRLMMIRRYFYFFSFSDEYHLSFELCNIMFWSQIIKLLNSSQLLVHTQQGDWDHSGNLNVTTILDKYLFIRVFQLRKWDCLNIYKDFQIATQQCIKHVF